MALNGSDQGCGVTWNSAFCVLPSAYCGSVRWLSPDPLGGDITNPQSLNRYAYALNNPTTLTDPSGLGPCDSTTGSEDWGPSDCSFGPTYGGLPVSYTLDGQDVPASVAIGALQGGMALPTSLAGTGAQLIFSSGDNFLFSYPAVIGTETATTAELQGNITGVSYSPIYGNGLLDVNLPTGVTAPGGFSIPASFSQTVEMFKNVGIAPSPLDNKLNPFHGTDFNLRDFRPVCSAHVTINVNSGQSPGQPTTGSIHFDAFNPTYSVPLYPIPSEGVQGGFLALHALGDVAPWWVGTKLGLNIPNAGSVCH